MKKIYLLIFAAVIFIGSAMGQTSSANYVFATSTAGSLTDMSAGTTQIVSAGSDDVSSPVTNIGFEFWFMGTRYTQFSANSNGAIRLGATAVAAGQYTLGSAGIPLISAFASDMIVSTTGKVHYKVIGTAPNRILDIEFKNITIIYDGIGTSTDGTYQVRLYEGTNAIEFVYGAMNRNTGTGFSNALNPQYIGFSANSTAGSYATISNTTNVSSTAAIVSNANTLGAPIVNLNSAVDGSRRVYNYAAPAPVAPSALNFTAVSATGMTLNWTDNSLDESSFAIYVSSDGGSTYNFVGSVAANIVTYAATGLFQNTNYLWKVESVREIASAAATGTQATLTAGNITSVGTGLWSSPATWSGGAVPTSNDIVTISGPDQVTIDPTNAAAYSLTVNGILLYDGVAARTLTVSTDVTVAAGGTLATPGTGTVTTNILSIAGNLTNNGTLNFSTNANTAGANITLTGAANNTFGGTGATTNIRTLTINKGANTNILELNPSNFTVQGTVVDGTPMAFLTLTAGTLKISGTFTLAGRVFSAAAYAIPAAAGFWLNNPNVTITGQNGTGTVTGMFRLTQGTYNVGTATGNALAFAAGANITIEGGTLNSTGRVAVAAAGNTITYAQTGGTITVCTIGNASGTLGGFDLGTSAGSSASISGGTVVFQLAGSAIDYRNQAGLQNITGGTLQFGNASSGAAKSFNIRGVAPNVIVTNTSAGHTATFGTTLVNWNNSSLDITLNTGTTLNLNNVQFFFEGTTLTNNGILTHTGVNSVFWWESLTGAPQFYAGTGIVTAPMTVVGIENDLTISATSPNIPIAYVALFDGNVTNANKITLGNGAATTGIIQIGNTTTATDAGNFDQPLTFNAGTGGVNVSYLRSTLVSRTMLNELPPSRQLTALKIDDNDPTHSLTLSGGDLTVNGVYTQTNGNVITGANTLVSGISVVAPGTFTYTGGVIIGNFKRWLTTTGANWNFPVGIFGTKRNASIDFTANPPTTGGTLTASWVSSPEGINGLPLGPNAQTNGEILSQTSAEGYWSVVAADGLAGGTYTGTFSGTGLTVADYTRLVLIKRPNNASAWVLDGNYIAPAPGNIVAASNMSGFSEFGLAADAGLVATNLNYFRGSKQGNANYLNWKLNVTGDAVAVSLQRSTDGSNFASINNTSATATSSLNPFDYTDASPVAGRDYYRLKMTELSGKVTYSSIVVLLSGTKGTEIVSIAPTVTSGTFNLNVSSVKAGTMIVMITDMSGQIVSKQMVTMIGGFNSINMDVSKLAAGTYRIFGINEDGRTNAAGFIKK